MSLDFDDDIDDTLGSLNVPDWVPPSDGHGSGGSGGGGYYEPVLTPIGDGTGGGSYGGDPVTPADPYLGPPQQASDSEPLPNSQAGSTANGTTAAASGFDGNTVLIGIGIVVAAIILLGGNDK